VKQISNDIKKGTDPNNLILKTNNHKIDTGIR
jgi:uncharacterized Zn ribbon protein